MKISTSKLSLLKFFVIPCLLVTVLLTACSKDNDGPDNGGGGYPKDVTIEYKVTSISGTTAGDIIYFNETGGNTILENVGLPFSKSFKRNVKQYDAATINFTGRTGGEVKVDILVDGKVVKSQNYSGTSVITGSLVYLFE